MALGSPAPYGHGAEGLVPGEVVPWVLPREGIGSNLYEGGVLSGGQLQSVLVYWWVVR